MVEDKIDDLVRQLFSKNDGVRVNARNALVKIGIPAVPALIDALKEKNLEARERATRVLGKIGDARAVPALIDGLKDEYEYVRLDAATALVRIGKPAVPAIIGELKDERYVVRKNAAKVLERIGPERIKLNEKILYLLVLGRTDLIVAIGKPAVPALIGGLKDKGIEVRNHASWALYMIVKKNPGNPKFVNAVPALIDALKDEIHVMRAAGALRKIIPSLTDIRLRETGGLLRNSLEKAEGKEKEERLNLLEKINKRRNELLAPEAKKLKLPKFSKRKKKPRRIWKAM